MTTEGREVNPDQISQHVVHPALHQDYVSDFQSRRATDIAPTLTSSILAGIASSMRITEGERSQNLDRPFVYLYNSEFPHWGAARTFSTECAVTVQ